MTSSGDLYLLRDNQTLSGQLILNVYFYEQTTPGGSAADLASAFDDTIIPTILGLQINDLTHTTIDVVNTDDPTDYSTLTSNEVGVATGDWMPPYVTYAFRLNRATRAVRHGQKRIGGVPEGNVVDGVVSGGAATDVAALATLLSADLVGDLGTYRPRIVRRTTTGGVTTYTAFPMSSASYVSISTQNTRKFGRGA